MGDHEHAEMLEAIARESLRVHLRDAGLNTREDDGRVWFGLGDVSCRVFANEGIERPDSHVVAFWFDLALDAGETKIISESLAGMGATLQEAAVTAAHDWLTTMFAPLRCWLDPEHHDDEVEVFPLPWMADDDSVTAWKVFAGPARVISRDNDAVLAELARGFPLILVLKALSRHLGQRRPHWVKTLLSTSPDGPHGEVRIDNEFDDDAFECLAQFQWPAHLSHGMFRQFYLLVPDRQAEPLPAEAVEQLRAMRDHLLGTGDGLASA